MIELGSQELFPFTGESAKTYYTNNNIWHTSIDLNGQNGALRLDLTKPIDLAPADIVTNHGTTEHVSLQEPTFKNIHNLCKVGGYMLHTVPLIGTWPGHGEYYYSLEFFSQLAKLNNYEVLQLKTINEGEYTGDLDLTWVIFRKINNDPFVWGGQDLLVHMPEFFWKY